MIYQDPLGALDQRWTIRRQIAEPLEVVYSQAKADSEPSLNAGLRWC